MNVIHYFSLISTAVLLLGIITAVFINNANYRKSEYYSVTHIPYFIHCFQMYFDKGHSGEYLTYKYLKSLNGYKKFLFNIYVPKDDGTFTEIDVIMLHESGIYVFESKNYSGWIFGTETQKNWTQSLPSGHNKTYKSAFLNPIIQNKVHIKWLQSYLNNDMTLPFYSYIVFSERCELKKITLTSNRHFVVKRDEILSAVSTKVSQSKNLLTRSKIEELFQKLYPLTQADDTLRTTHIQTIQEKYRKPVASQPKPIPSPVQKETDKTCPRCGGHLILRTAKKGDNSGQQFYGCSNYPHCRYIKKIT